MLFWGTLLGAITVGAQLEAPAEMAFGLRFALHAWILAVFAGVFLLRPAVLALVRNEWASWVVVLAGMVLVGGLTDLALGL